MRMEILLLIVLRLPVFAFALLFHLTAPSVSRTPALHTPASFFFPCRRFLCFLTYELYFLPLSDIETSNFQSLYQSLSDFHWLRRHPSLVQGHHHIEQRHLRRPLCLGKNSSQMKVTGSWADTPKISPPNSSHWWWQ